MELRYIIIPIGILLYVITWILSVRLLYIGMRDRNDGENFWNVTYNNIYSTAWIAMHVSVLIAILAVCIGYYMGIVFSLIITEIIKYW
jgi:ABC-type sulfate transport system permease component